MQVQVSVTLEEAYFGTSRRLRILRPTQLSMLSMLSRSPEISRDLQICPGVAHVTCQDCLLQQLSGPRCISPLYCLPGTNRLYSLVLWSCAKNMIRMIQPYSTWAAAGHFLTTCSNLHVCASLRIEAVHFAYSGAFQKHGMCQNYHGT